MVPVERFTHAEIGREVVVYSELDVTGVQQPGLVTGWITRNVVTDSCPIRVNHQSRYPARCTADQRGRNLVTGCSAGLGSVGVGSDRIKRAVTHERIALRIRRCAERIINLSRIFAEIANPGCGKDAATERVSRCGVAESRQDT